MRSSSSALVLLVSFLFGCGPAPADTPDAGASDAAACPAAAYASEQLLLRYRQRTEADDSADIARCEHYRAAIELLEVDEGACTLSGTFGYAGFRADGSALVSSVPFTCSLRESGAGSIDCTADELDVLEGQEVSMHFTSAESGGPTLTMTLTASDGSTSHSCVDAAVP